MKKELEIIEIVDDVMLVSHRNFATGVELDEESISRLIRKHKSDLEEFGVVGFDIRPTSTNLKPNENEKTDFRAVTAEQKTYLLNEQQVTLLFSYLQNTPIARRFKIALVKEFFAMREIIRDGAGSCGNDKYMKLLEKYNKLLEDKLRLSNKSSSPRAHQPYSEEEESLFISMRNEGHSLRDVAIALERNYESVVKKASRFIADGLLVSQTETRKSDKWERGEVFGSAGVASIAGCSSTNVKRTTKHVLANGKDKVKVRNCVFYVRLVSGQYGKSYEYIRA